MDGMVTAPISVGAQNRQVSIEAGMLELFAPTNSRPSQEGFFRQTDNSRLWRSDAIHRAKNMAQLAISLANVAAHPSRRWLPDDVVAQARGLARAYEELGVEYTSADEVPCAPLLKEVATRLTGIFGRARDITVIVVTDLTNLAPELRRALVLMCSEMIINALKYGYPSDDGGTIRVSLTEAADRLTLVVEDDGIGLVVGYSAGHGGGLLDQLGAVLGATVARSSGNDGHGYRIEASMPLRVTQREYA